MRIGLDIGSTTVKLVALDDSDVIRFSSYQRHAGRIPACVQSIVSQMERALPGLKGGALAVSGSAGMGLSEACDLPFVQEVHATRIAAQHLNPGTDAVIELGGEDAKVLFLSGLMDARMNGSCAGGTGAFIDQMATLMQITPEALNERAKEKERIYTIASRCGVFAKTDVQPLLNQGARIEDVCASILYSVVNQTIAGLAQGREIAGNVLYLGGPLTFLSELRAAFDRILKIEGTLPENSLYYVAIGTAMRAEKNIDLDELARRFAVSRDTLTHVHTDPLFSSADAYDAFVARHAGASVPSRPAAGFSGRAHLGIDAGSTTIKTALIDDGGALLHTTYHPSSGNPVPILQADLLSLQRMFPDMRLASATVTGYGEQLVLDAFCADHGIIETIAHFTAAKAFQPQVDFIIDIGGQDMKCFRIQDGAIGDIFLNEACSSGCGSFLQTFAEALGQDIAPFSQLGLFADAPVDLGSRCTVFMNSSVKQAQKDGASIENISAGLAISVVKNALYKVIRASDPAALGRHIVVQGGTFHNDAVLRAFEKELGYDVVRPNIAGLMGAYGAALYGKAHAAEGSLSTLLSGDALARMTHERRTAGCTLCGNNCLLTINLFDGSRRSISGNRCDRPISKAPQNSEALDMYAYKQRLLDSLAEKPGPNGTIGIPMVLNQYELLPFWHALLSGLGFRVVTSPPSSRALYFKGQRTIPSDTVCYPAKLAHGHIQALSERADVDMIFYPCMTYNIDEQLGDNHFNCPVVAYYPEVIAANCGQLGGKPLIKGYVGIHHPKAFARKMHEMLSPYAPQLTPAAVRQAVKQAYAAYDAHLASIRSRTAEVIEQARAERRPIIVLAGRPYHIDSEINHGIGQLIRRYGAAVVSEDGISHLLRKQHTNILNQWSYHARLFSAARYVCSQPDMQLVQLVSFGCGLDAVTADEVRAILADSGKLYTQIKIDEIANLGAVNIRLRSLFAALGLSDRPLDHLKDRQEAI